MSDAGCVFCAIVAGTAPASIVWEDKTSVGFMDIDPITPGHVLVVPRTHAASLAELDPRTGGLLFEVAMRVAAGLRASEVRADGLNLFLADGGAAGQDVFHVHIHVVPRYPGDGLEIRYAGTRPPREQLDATAASIRDGLARMS